jgi:epoxyqueuosine reductase QueG
METLTNEVVTWLKDNGASIVGVSPVERFDGAPKGHHPRDFLQEASSVVTFGVALLHQSLYWEEHLVNSELIPPEHRKDLLQNYFYRQTGYNMVNDFLNRLALSVSNFLESWGYLSLFFPATYGTEVQELIRRTIPSGWGLLSQRHAAVRAGLGEFGLNNVVLTPEYGPRIRFNSVITEADLTHSPLLTQKVCLGESCSICLQSCPGAISLRSGFDPEAVWYDTPARTNIAACRELSCQHYCLGRCIKVCPVSQYTLTKSVNM